MNALIQMEMMMLQLVVLACASQLHRERFLFAGTLDELKASSEG